MVTLAIALLIVVAVSVVAWPFFSTGKGTEIGLTRMADSAAEGLVALRDATYASIKDLEFDREMGKLSDADYRSMRAKLEAKAVSILQELDTLKATQAKPAKTVEGEDLIEREVQELRRSVPASGSLKCSKCGTAHTAGDAFCAKCGSSLRGVRCPNCGTRAAVGDKFCARCGARVKG